MRVGIYYKEICYRTGRLTEEEKRRKLEEMTGNANVHEEARWARLHAARKRDKEHEAEEEELKKKALAARNFPHLLHS